MTDKEKLEAIKDNDPTCHFKPMSYVIGEYGESWFECEYCGHSKKISDQYEH